MIGPATKVLPYCNSAPASEFSAAVAERWVFIEVVVEKTLLSTQMWVSPNTCRPCSQDIDTALQQMILNIP